jgi:hypothetical protein
MFLGTDYRHLFPGQQENERVYLVFRQHWIVMFGKLAAWFIFLGIFISIDYLIAFIPGTLTPGAVNLIELFKLVYLALLFLGLFILWIMYYLNIITNERIVDITQKSLLHHTISELHLNQIEDVTAEMKGFFQTFFNYGNVYIQTAGETERFEFTKVPNPSQINKVILDLYELIPEEQKKMKN